jgi:short subunit dehydrogenase-like uncharacterized protein
MKDGVLIYGCYGYTGKLISELAAKTGLKAVLSGRDEQKVAAMAKSLNLDYKAFSLDNEDAVAEQLKNFKVVLHCAGPFINTVGIMANACIKAKTHYLDITGEYQVFESNFALNDKAIAAGIMLMSGVGFDVVPSDCLARYLSEKMPDADSLELALQMKGGRISHGTAITVAENLGYACLLRRNGKLVEVPNGKVTREVEFDGGTRTGVAISWGDISTAYRSTGISNITVYNALPQKVIDSMKASNYLGFLLRSRFVKNILINRIKKRPAGPNETERQTATSVVWGEVRNKTGGKYRAELTLPEGYTLTAHTAVRIAQLVLEKEPPAGAKTPSQVFGKDFILQFDGVSRKDLL